MIGRKKSALVVVGLVVLLAAVIGVLLIANQSDDESTSKDSKKEKSEITSTTKSKTSTTIQVQDSTTTSLVLEGVSVSVSTPVPNQKFSNETVIVRAIIEGAPSGTCNLKFSKSGSKSFEIEAPVIAAPTYFTCEGFDVEPSNFTDKGEWTMELKVKTANGESGSEKRKITVS